MENNIKIIGIGSCSGGGKTAVTKQLVSILRDAIAIHYDDYSDFIIDPPIETWQHGVNLDDFKTPRIKTDLVRLKAGGTITHPITGKIIGPARYIVFDCALGKNHKETGHLIDHMFFIDTPLDIAMARRIKRDYPATDNNSLLKLHHEIDLYLAGMRNAYLEMEKNVKQPSDYVVDGKLSILEISNAIQAAVRIINS